MILSSSAFQDHHPIPTRYTSEGENIHPPLAILDAPLETQSLALVFDDPDTILAFTHWMVWDIDPLTLEIPEGTLPPGIHVPSPIPTATEGITDFGKRGYEGPSPSQKVHEYFFRLYALSRVLNLPPSSRRDDLFEALKGLVLAEASLRGLYRRSR